MKTNLSILLLVIWLPQIHAQSVGPQVIGASGSSMQGPSIQLDWTLGELAITSLENQGSQITQGFHQPNYTLTSLAEFPDEIGKVNVFPNPTSDQVEIHLNFNQPQRIHLQLVNSHGKQIWTKDQQGLQIIEHYDLAELANGMYFLQVSTRSFHQIFKIIKHN